jgi:rhodanese-related sulfurtransferase
MDHSPRFLALVDAARARVRELSVAAYAAAPPAGAILVDVREDSEWAAGHAEGAVHLGKGVLERDVEKRFPDLDAPLVLYCGGGFRSAISAAALVDMGYRNVWSLDGGWKGWVAAGLPVRTPGAGAP